MLLNCMIMFFSYIHFYCDHRVLTQKKKSFALATGNKTHTQMDDEIKYLKRQNVCLKGLWKKNIIFYRVLTVF